MDSILHDFGIQPLLLAAQVVNFLVLLFILQKVLYKPMLKVLKERKEKIAESLKNAEEIELKLKKTEEDREKKIADASKEARGIIEDATKAANQVIAEAHQKASSDIEDMVAKGRQSIELEREKMQNEIRGELADLIAVAMQKVTGKVLTDKDQKDIIQKTVKEI